MFDFCRYFYLLSVLSIAAPTVATLNAVDKAPDGVENFSSSEEPGAVLFTPPAGWRFADQKLKYVHVMVVGKGDHDFPPSINLGTENYKGTLKEYLKIVKDINDKQGALWKDLGAIRTEAGEASLSQVDIKTNWGEVREMHVILLKNEKVYILTAAALKEEFPKFYKEFFQSLRSLRINKTCLELVDNEKKRSQLQHQLVHLQQSWDKLLANSTSTSQEAKPQELVFSDKEFQEKYWVPFTNMLEQQYSEMGEKWKKFLVKQTKDDLLTRSKKVEKVQVLDAKQET